MIYIAGRRHAVVALDFAPAAVLTGDASEPSELAFDPYGYVQLELLGHASTNLPLTRTVDAFVKEMVASAAAIK